MMVSSPFGKISFHLQKSCSQTLIPWGISEFWRVNAAPPPFLDGEVFCQMCYALVRKNGGTVAEVDTDTAIRNFYFTKLSRYDQFVFILQDIHDPYGAFAQRDTSSAFVLTNPSEWLQLPEGQVHFQSLAKLNQDWRGLGRELSPEDLEQIRYWKSQTVERSYLILGTSSKTGRC